MSDNISHNERYRFILRARGDHCYALNETPTEDFENSGSEYVPSESSISSKSDSCYSNDSAACASNCDVSNAACDTENSSTVCDTENATTADFWQYENDDIEADTSFSNFSTDGNDFPVPNNGDTIASSIVAADSGISENFSQREKNTQLNYAYVHGYRINSLLLWSVEEKQFYRYNSTSKIGKGYSCYVDHCLARVHVRDGKCFHANSVAHNHATKEQMYVDLMVLSETKSILSSVENNLPSRQVFNIVVAK